VAACNSQPPDKGDTCVLTAGHSGMHVGGRGTAWGNAQPQVQLATDPLVERMVGRAYHGDTPFDVPYMSEIIEGQLWQGGCTTGLVLPKFIRHVVSLYPWEAYVLQHDLVSMLAVPWLDGDLPNLQLLRAVAHWVAACMEDGPVLVHCQAGLNRSSLVAAAALIAAKGMEGSEAVYLLRGKRSEACLCNMDFYEWVVSPAARQLLWPMQAAAQPS
jgi:protein-tyrosine phosphatase